MSARIVSAAMFALCLSTPAASADECSGHSYTRSTVGGATAGGTLGGLVSHGSGGGIVAGAPPGISGNSVQRYQDCRERKQYYYHAGHRYEHRRYYDGRYHYW